MLPVPQHCWYVTMHGWTQVITFLAGPKCCVGAGYAQACSLTQVITFLAFVIHPTRVF
ncbi:MAG: hypothetical protein KatS3mg055_3099 [Chloroflexus sp.]|uniref:hypothetical protein n=1 Tax=Chloroflexus sp. TaxID=1904827 RepID=UPI0021DD0AD5|nr:hypothetical protein [Chloroflexus sp.]GIV90581.1 MAG: hypothetical protein KatS3mg055_3099 [Chloroflexus sp.]